MDKSACSTLAGSFEYEYVMVGAASLSISCVMSVYVLSKCFGGTCMKMSQSSKMSVHGTV